MLRETTITSSELVDSVLLEQYRHCAEDWRHFDRLLWQIPFSTAAVVSAVIAIVYGYFQEQTVNIPMEVKVLLFSSLIVFVVAMALLSRKVRFFQEGRTKFLNNLIDRINNLQKEKKNASIEKLPFETKEILKLFNKREQKKFLNYRAINFQNLLYFSFIFILSFLLYYEGKDLCLVAFTVVSVVIILTWFYDEIVAKLRAFFCPNFERSQN